MASQRFNIRWNNHNSNILEVLQEQFENETHVDVTLTCQGKFIKAHKIVLGACSPYFQEILRRHDSVTHPVIIMSGFKFEDIRSIVGFMYRGVVKVCDSDLEQLLAAAESLQVKGLRNVKATRSVQNQSVRWSELKSSTKNSGSNNIPNSYLTANGSVNGGFYRISNCSSTTSLISSSATHAAQNHGGRAPHVLINNVGRSGNSETKGAPMHRRRKRARISTSKDIKVNNTSEIKTWAKVNAHAAKVSAPVDEDNSNDRPLIMKIEPRYIRDIDDEDDVEWGSQNATAESCDGPEEVKAGLMEPKEKIPRPPNAFMIFANEWRRKLAMQHANKNNNHISVRLGIMWKNLPSDLKENYFSASHQASEDHKKKYPDYYYNPQEARMRKQRKLQQQQVSQMMTAGQYNPIHFVNVSINDKGDGMSHSASQNHSSGNNSYHPTSQTTTHWNIPAGYNQNSLVQTDKTSHRNSKWSCQK